ncbi:MAG TPA: SIMPL domain-containing protein [Candidatus Omnitrophica bacterium]|nr:SIMPL domain-containing protein [Candidatus Omnitrophota bacterium]
MEGIKVLRSTQIIILGVCFVVATIVSTVIFSQGLIKIKKFSSEVIKVTGSAEKNIVSDYMVWTSSFSRKDLKMVDAFSKLKEDLVMVKEYLSNNGVTQEELIIYPVATEVLYKKTEKGTNTNEIEGYRLTQGLEMRSKDVTKTTDISRRSTELIEKGIEFMSYAPEYFYTKLPELKLEMLAEATSNAKKRAEQMAVSTGNKIGVMRSARMGVFQITPVNSFDVSDYGYNDTSSLEKKVNAVVNVEFAISE